MKALDTVYSITNERRTRLYPSFGLLYSNIHITPASYYTM